METTKHQRRPTIEFQAVTYDTSNLQHQVDHQTHYTSNPGNRLKTYTNRPHNIFAVQSRLSNANYIIEYSWTPHAMAFDKLT